MTEEEYKQLEKLIGKLHIRLMDLTGNSNVSHIGIINNYLQDGYHVGLYVYGDIDQQFIVMNLKDVENEISVKP